MRKLSVYIAIIIFISVGCTQKENVDFVNPFIGTGGHGHTYPGAAYPFGMVQLSPDTRIDSWDGCSGYHYSDSTILGFSHTHLSGTGIGDYGDIRVMPTVGGIQFYAGSEEDPSKGYRSRFSHENEIAEAGYYAVRLDDYDIDVELTVGERFGLHKYEFPKTKLANVLFDLTEGVTSDIINGLGIQVLSDTSIAGFRKTKGWAHDQRVYFYAVFSRPFEEYSILNEGSILEDAEGFQSGKNIKANLRFNTTKDQIIYLKVGISATSIKNAKINLEESKEWDFEKQRQLAKQSWANSLNKIDIKGGTETQRTTFYTALYHSLLNPNLFSDANGSYRGHDKQVHQSDRKMYTVFSLWDTFRALHPLFTIIEQDKTTEFIYAMLDMYEKGGLLPVWELSGNETNCMIGYHAIPVIYDAIKKKIFAKDDIKLKERVLNAMLASARHEQFGLSYYKKEGFVPAGKEGEAVSKTLEYAYDDWCIAQLAKDIGNEKVFLEFIMRSQSWKNIFDREIGFMRGKMNGEFVTPFDPTEVNFMLTEANTWQYNFFVPHDIDALVNYLGGDLIFIQKLDELFKTATELSGRHQSDITGLIGQYAHGNEPSHNMAYLYNYVGTPWKGAKIIRKIMDDLYTDQPDGLCGNEDCGQMSAWYVLSAMGFYPVCPGDNQYAIGTPLFDQVIINLESGAKFKITAKNLSAENIYIQSVTYNGQDYDQSFILHEMIEAGGELKFVMGNEPSEWATELKHWPKSSQKENLITEIPYFKSSSKTFTKQHSIELLSINCDAEIYYTTDGTIPDQNSFKYKNRIQIKESTKFKAVAYASGVASKIVEAQYLRIPGGRKLTITNPYSSQYTAGGDIGLVDYIKGGENFRTGSWQGYYGVDLEVVIDLGKIQRIQEISAGFLQEQRSWIWMPRTVEYSISEDGVTFHRIASLKNEIADTVKGGFTKEFIKKEINKNTRYIKVFAKSIEVCPDWHVGAGNKAWIFIDEILIK